MANTRPPLVISCQGGTRVAQLAADVASALDDLGVAEAVHDLDEVLTSARAGGRVIALDGCASACRARMLEAKGLRPEVAFNLAELGVDAQTVGETDPARLAAETAARLRARPAVRRQTRAPRPARPALAPRMKRAHVVDDYLLAIDALASPTVECGALAADAPTLAAHVSRLLGVSRASAGEMVARLEEEGLVERGARRELLLTRRGRAAADRAVHRHRLFECFVSDFLGYPPAEWYAQAAVLGGAFGDEAPEHLARALGEPTRCPHGWPLDPHRARDESRELTALSAIAGSEPATIVRVVEWDGALVGQLHELGLTPGTTVRVERTSPGIVAIELAGVTRHLDAVAAASVFIRP